MKNKKVELLKKYFEENPGVFNKVEQTYLLAHALSSKASYNDELVRELYDELGLMPEKDNIYNSFIELLEDNFDLDGKNIIEVGGGHLPRLSKRLLSSNENIGVIRVYDPKLSRYEKNTSRLKLYHHEFTENCSHIEGTDLFIGLMPCNGTYSLVKSAVDNGKDFMVALCEGGDNGDIYDYEDRQESWLESILTLAKKSGEVEIDYDTMAKYDDKYPIIYTKKR